MLKLSSQAKTGEIFKHYSFLILCFLAIMPQVLPLLVVIPDLPTWFKNTVSVIAALGVIAQFIKQNGFKPATT